VSSDSCQTLAEHARYKQSHVCMIAELAVPIGLFTALLNSRHLPTQKTSNYYLKCEASLAKKIPSQCRQFQIEPPE
jgi:hypothetical protein